MKKITLILLVVFSLVTMTACQKPEVQETTYTVTFESNGGTTVASATVNEGEAVPAPTAPTKEGFVFQYWFITDELIEYAFSTTVTADLTLQAFWGDPTDAYLIGLDIAYFEANMYLSTHLLNLTNEIELNGSEVEWDFDSMYISDEGIILPLPDGEADMSVELTGEFTLNDTVITETFDIPLTQLDDVVLATSNSYDFENLTTEYEVADGSLELYFEEDGSVPYVKITDFFGLVTGFIDPEVDFTITTVDGVLTIEYQYYDEDEDETYDMVLTVDSTENTIDVNDPAFYWAYVYSTATNYGRHIEYDFDNVNASFDEGHSVFYDLDDFNMDIVFQDGEVLLPYYMTNQLFAGSSYFNVYYNGEGLYGIYSLPDSGSLELRTIQNSEFSGDKIPADLLVHTFNMLAFDLDNLYGLKDIMGITTYYDLLYSKKDDLLTRDAEDLELAIRNLLLKSIDEPHTSYGYHSYFNKTRYNGPDTSSLSFYGPRFVNWYSEGLSATDDAIYAKWGGAATGWNYTQKPDYWFLDSVTASVALNDFYTADIEESSTFDITIAETILEIDDLSGVLPAVNDGDLFYYFNQSSEQANKLEILVKNVDAAYLDTYKADLVTLGLNFVLETTTDTKKDEGYYSVTIAEQDYMVQVDYDDTLDMLYIGVALKLPTTYDAIWSQYVDIPALVETDSAIYFQTLLERIVAERPGVENIVLDLTWNTGGNIGALYRIVGFITDDPFQVSSIDGDTDGSSTYFVDINDGIPSYAYLNWSLLVTPTTFSAANEMATIFMANDLGVIIGKTSGGGACSITPILLPNGTAFTMSSNNISAYRTGTGTTEDPYIYHNTEFGITPDYELDIEDIYDEALILAIVNP